MSVVARAPNEASEAFVWTQIASLAVAESVEKVIRDRVWIKWPNDLMLTGRKLCGVLAEREEMLSGEAFMVVGIGLNVQSAPEEASGAICLRDVTSRLPRRADLVRSILEGFETRCNEFRRHGSEAIREPWMARSLLLGKQVQVEEEGRITRGRVEDFLPDGRLLLCCEDRSQRVFAAGDVSVLPQQANL
jgi:BirA family biotin operon repressor/biotin-[acetyl-CoA-carboxylase] ligase